VVAVFFRLFSRRDSTSSKKHSVLEFAWSVYIPQPSKTSISFHDHFKEHGPVRANFGASLQQTFDKATVERIWLESKKRLPEYVARKPANLQLRSQYSIRFYDWAKKYVEVRTKTVSLEELRRVLGLESVKDADGNVIHEAPMPVWANFRQRALDVAILEISAKTDLKIKLVSIRRSKHRRVVALDFTIKTQAIPKRRRAE
jgi:hypothetical protein